MVYILKTYPEAYIYLFKIKKSTYRLSDCLVKFDTGK